MNPKNDPFYLCQSEEGRNALKGLTFEGLKGFFATKNKRMNKQCPTTTLPCIKECKEGECALKDPFGIFNKLNERHYAENFINFLLYKGLNLQNGKFYFFKNGLGEAFSVGEILDLYMEEKETPV